MLGTAILVATAGLWSGCAVLVLVVAIATGDYPKPLQRSHK